MTRVRTRRGHVASSRPLPQGFNQTCYVDILFTKFMVILHFLCGFSRLSGAAELRSRTPAQILLAAHAAWFAHFGCPPHIVSDEEGALGSNFATRVFEAMRVQVDYCSPDSHEKLLVERHHPMLEQLVDKGFECDMSLRADPEDRSLVLQPALWIKNSSFFYGGFTPHQLAFGTSGFYVERWG